MALVSDMPNVLEHAQIICIMIQVILSLSTSTCLFSCVLCIIYHYSAYTMLKVDSYHFIMKISPCEKWLPQTFTYIVKMRFGGGQVKNQ